LPEEFDYSRALNIGIEAARGDLIVSLSAHAIPLDEQWLGKMTAPFADESVAGVACRQVPWPNASWEEVRRLSNQFGSTRREYSSDNLDGMTFSNAGSCVRRSVWREMPFTLPAAEDLDWAERVIAAGWRIVYEPEAVAYHSHDESARATAHRLMDISRAADSGESGRGRWRAVREATGYARRESGAVLGLDEPFRRKLAYLVEAARVAWYYVIDFSRSGTTAERRREDSQR
jgi:GT2 family glycosyltransferase